MKRLFAVCFCVGSLVRVGSAVLIPVNCNLSFNSSNAVQVGWNVHYTRLRTWFLTATCAHMRETLSGRQSST